MDLDKQRTKATMDKKLNGPRLSSKIVGNSVGWLLLIVVLLASAAKSTLAKRGQGPTESAAAPKTVI